MSDRYYDNLTGFSDLCNSGGVMLARENGGAWHDITVKSALSVGFAASAGSVENAVSANSATYAVNAGSAASAGSAVLAGSALAVNSAAEATHAISADSATNANSAASAAYAVNAGSAASAGSAVLANSATTAGSATSAVSAGTAGNASSVLAWGSRHVVTSQGVFISALTDGILFCRGTVSAAAGKIALYAISGNLNTQDHRYGTSGQIIAGTILCPRGGQYQVITQGVESPLMYYQQLSGGVTHD